MDIELVELEDWNCCGASSAHALDTDIDLALSARTIYLCHREGLEMAVPCAACYSRTAHAWQVMMDDMGRRKEFEDEFGFTFREDLHIYHLLQVIDKATESHVSIISSAAADLGVKKVVCYYGCLINRPRGINPHDDMENPQTMERILERYGYEPVPWSFATECCGAALSLTRDDVVTGLVERIISAAREAGADAIVTGCPLCQMNLESRQTEPFRVFYFTELLGAALGIAEVEDWWKMHLVDPTIQ
jgi:heterodisulfide reductase subunit B